MAYIDNSETKKEINDAIRGNAVSNIAPSQLANQVIPVIDVNPKRNRRCNITRRTGALNATSATIYTTPSDKDFYLCAFALSIIKDATSTSISSNILATIDGVSQNLLSIPELTLTAQAQSISQSLAFPLKIDRGTAITVTNSTNVANISAIGIIQGFTVEN